MGRSRLVVAASAMLALCIGSVKAQPTPRFDPLMESGTQGFGSMLRISPFDPNTVITTGDIFGAAISVDAGQTWQVANGLAQTNGNNPCCNDITFLSRSTVWLGTLAGPYLSSDGGHTWTIERSGMPTPIGTDITAPIQKVIADPNNNSTLLAFGGNHRHMGYGDSSSHYGTCWRSTNGGSTWTNYSTIGAGGISYQVNDACFGVGSSSIVYAATDSGLYESTNGGSSFSLVGNGLPAAQCYTIAVNPANANVIYVGFTNNDGVYETTNGGTTWTQQISGIANGTGGNPNDLSAAVYTLAISPTSPNVIYLGFWGATYYSNSTTGNPVWTKIAWAGSNSTVSPASGVPGNMSFACLSVDPSTPSTVMGTGSSNVWRSTNSGTGWITCTNYPTNSAYRGQGWSGLNGMNVAWNPNIAGQVWTSGGDSGKQLRSNDYLWSWLTGDSFTGSKGPYNGSHGVSFSNDSGTLTTYIATGQFGDTDGTYGLEPIIKYTGGNWSYLTYPYSSNVGECMSIYSNPTNSQQIWGVFGITGAYYNDMPHAHYNRIYYSSNGGSSWADITPSGTDHVYNIAVNPLTPGVLYVGGDNGVYQSTSGSGGATFQSTAMSLSPSDGQLNYVYADPSATASIYAIQYKRSSTNIEHYNGSGWSNVGWIQWAYALAVDPNNALRLAVTSKSPSPTYDLDPSTGIYLSSNGGSTWTAYGQEQVNSGPAITFNPDFSSQLIGSMDGGDVVCDWGTSVGHSGSPVTLPATIQASLYDTGGSKIAYYNGGSGVSTTTGDGGNVLNNLTAGEWIKYEITAPSVGSTPPTNYNLDIRYSGTATTTTVHFEANGVNITGPINLGSTSGYTDKVVPVRLLAGTQYLKLHVDQSGGATIHTLGLSYVGALSGSTTGGTAGFSLTTLTPLVGNDWAAYGAGGTSFTTFDDKKTGFQQISTASEYGGAGGNWGAYSNTEFNVSWTDGTPTTSTTEGAIIYENQSDPSGTTTWGIQFTAPASTVSHTLYIFWGGSQCTYELNAHLSDSSAPDYNTGGIVGPASGSQLQQTTITYNAASAGQTVTLTLTKVSNNYTGGSTTNGSVNLTCAWLH